MTINVEKDNGKCRMQIEGEMTVFTAAELKKMLLDSMEDCSDIEMDLSGVSEMDTAGFQLVLLIYNEASLSNKSVRLTSYSPAVEAVFDLFCMDTEKFN